MPRFERPERATPEHLPKLTQFIAEKMEGYRVKGIPVKDSGRIDMAAYRNLYPDVDRDLQKDAEWLAKWQKEGSASGGENAIFDSGGEKLEVLASAVFAKNLGPDFAVVRAAPHDDRNNQVDTILFDLKTGNIVCAFDEVSDTSDVTYQSKSALVREHNLNGGASLKYGLGIEKGEEKIVLRENKGLPIFYIALSKNLIDKGLAEFLPEDGKQSPFEDQLFEYFSLSIKKQIVELEMRGQQLDPETKKRIKDFKGVMDRLDLKRKQDRKT